MRFVIREEVGIMNGDWSSGLIIKVVIERSCSRGEHRLQEEQAAEGFAFVSQRMNEWTVAV